MLRIWPISANVTPADASTSPGSMLNRKSNGAAADGPSELAASPEMNTAGSRCSRYLFIPNGAANVQVAVLFAAFQTKPVAAGGGAAEVDPTSVRSLRPTTTGPSNWIVIVS